MPRDRIGMKFLGFGCDTSSLRFPTKMLLASIQSIFLFAIEIGERGSFSICYHKHKHENEISKEPKNATVVSCVCTRCWNRCREFARAAHFLFCKSTTVARAAPPPRKCLHSFSHDGCGYWAAKAKTTNVTLFFSLWNNAIFLSIKFSSLLQLPLLQSIYA